MTLLDLAADAVGFAFNWLLQSTVLIVAGVVVGRLLWRRGSATQSVVYRTTLVAVLVCPMATWTISQCGVSGWSVAMPPAWTLSHKSGWNGDPAGLPQPDSERTTMSLDNRNQTSSTGYEGSVRPFDANAPLDDRFAPSNSTESGQISAAKVVEQPAAHDSTGTGPLPAASFSVHGFGKVAIVASLLWMLITAGLLARLAVAWSRLSGVRRRAHAADSSMIEICRQLSSKLVVSPPDVLHTPYLPSPCLAGLRRPAVLLPEAELGLSIHDVLVHELAHLLRHDCHWNLLRKVATALFFFQPLLWKLSHRLEMSAEEVCDDFVVQYGGNRSEYANRLVDIAEFAAVPMATAAVAIVSLRSMLAHRVVRIMDTSRQLSTRVSHLLILLAMAGGIIATAIIGFLGVAPLRSLADAKTAELQIDATLDEPSEPVAAGTANSVKADSDLISVSGRVVDPDGEPISGAKLYALGTMSSQISHEVRSVTNKKGEFAFQMKREEFGLEQNEVPWWCTKIIAVAEGYGFDFQAACSFEPSGELMSSTTVSRFPIGNRWDRMLRLVKDDVPIVGRITDANGKPVANATVGVSDVWIPKAQDLSPWEKAVEKGEDYDVVREMMDRGLWGIAMPIIPDAVTQPDGTFRLSGGIGRERIARLRIAGAGIVNEMVYVRTRTGQTYDVPHVLEAPSGGSFRFFGSTVDYTAKPSLPIEGTVRDKDSAEPVAGVLIRFEPGSSNQNLFMEFDRGSIDATTDGKGWFRLTGAPLGDDHTIMAIPSGQPYLPASKQVTLAAGQPVPNVAFDLTKGVKIEGRITDAETGAPVEAQVTYFLPVDNPLYRAVKDLNGTIIRGRWEFYTTGEYANVGLPGRGFLAVMAKDHRNYPRGGGPAQTREKYKEWPRLMLDTSPYSCIPEDFHYVAEVDIPNNVDSYKFDIALTSEKRLEGTLVDPAGNPLAGATGGGITENDGPYFSLATPQFNVLSYQPDKPRQVFFLHQERRLAGSVLLEGPHTDPINVQLEPWGAIIGRIVDGNGNPQANALIRGHAPGHGGRPGRGELPERHYQTDEQGRFRIEGFVPGLQYELELIVDGDVIPTTEMDFGVKSGETRDLGDVTIQPK
jgi:beta-lactamase regulating signal transducer with metallopeptidase domain